ncbi:MAG: FMN-binding protein [Erysipelotrichaceae bacterium]|nr:FMN-binding protein [Erysipelotrichaceae bacterium]
MKKIISLFIILLVSISLTACGSTDSANDSTESNDSKYTAGTYSETVSGHNGDITVDVTFSDSAITDITIVEAEETEGLGDTALETVSEAIIEAQSTDVDTVSGATVSSEALIEAVNSAITNATK